jgi:ring-1,2-phenylacetyl-CoA epoxidase subunit PaaB
MTDTQWPRFMVFQQETAGEPFVHDGTVHAPDIELAMQNARDVFVRRPEAAALWVVPADAIYSQTREELAASSVIARSAQHDETISRSDLQSFYVFGKLTEQAQASELGEVMASSSAEALRAALEKFHDKEVLRWYIFPASAVLKSDPADADPMFAPARDKTYKDQAEYPVVTMMRQIRAKGQLRDDE